jgi:hypothetical protein
MIESYDLFSKYVYDSTNQIPAHANPEIGKIYMNILHSK